MQKLFITLLDQKIIFMAEIQRWNKLDNFTISPGQRLVVGNPLETETIADANLVQPEQVELENVTEIIAQEFIPMGWSAEEYKAFQELPATYETVKESGLAAMIEGSTTSKKYLALHRTAPVGTVIGVRNEMNDQMVFVRVLGKLPDVGDNDRIIMRISKAAYDNISAIDQKFRVELTYYK